MRKTITELIDELAITHCKIYELVGKAQNRTATKEEMYKIQDLNAYRSRLKNAMNEFFNEQKEIKV